MSASRYGIGLARVFQAAGLVVVEVERPRRPDRRRGKSDPIDAHLADLHVLRLDADRLHSATTLLPPTRTARKVAPS
jgi:hypothetical protein